MLTLFSLTAGSSTEGETRLSGTIKPGTIMMKAGTIIPQSLRVETEPYSHGWEIIKNSDADAVDRDIRRADWNFFFLAGNMQATALGCWGERTIRRAIERVLAKAKPSKLNCPGFEGPRPLASHGLLPIVPVGLLRFSCGLMPTWCAWVSSYALCFSVPALPIALSAQGSSAYEPRLTGYASVSRRNSHRSTCQELKEQHQRV